MLTIQDLSVKVNEKLILDNLNITLPPGEVHALMGPNGSGKSTLANVLAGDPTYDIIAGKVNFNGKNLFAFSPNERSLAGLFLAFQHPIEIPGVANSYFLNAALNAHLKHQGKTAVDPFDFLQKLKMHLKELDMPDALLHRALNEGFSGGEKKRNEILQCLILQPKLIILDETDSGLDIDSLKTMASVLNQLRNKERSFLIITHYQRILNYIEPDKVHIMINGKLKASGDKRLADELDKKGYGGLNLE